MSGASYLLETRLDVAELERQHGGALTIHHVREVARSLGAMERNVRWWVGDLLVDAEARFGEEYAQLEADLEIEPKTAANYRWVSASVAPSRRREELTWSHHAEVAALQPKQQTEALQWAIDENATVRQLREYVALEHPQAPPGEPLFDEREHEEIQARLERIERELEAGEEIDRSDVAWLIVTLKRVTRNREPVAA